MYVLTKLEISFMCPGGKEGSGGRRRKLKYKT